MTLKKKLTLGLGFLFFLVFALAIFYSVYLGKLARDGQDILKDNYKSLIYSKNMALALEDMRTAVANIVFNPAHESAAPGYYEKLFDANKAKFEENLGSERGNITEIHEEEYVAALNKGYELYGEISRRLVTRDGGAALYFSEYQPAVEKLQRLVNDINDINMQAVERKSQLAKRDSARIINLTAGFGVFCLILAFGYFWYFPFYVSNSIAYLAGRMEQLLKKSQITLDTKTNDEAFILLQGINLLENQLDAKPKD